MGEKVRGEGCKRVHKPHVLPRLGRQVLVGGDLVVVEHRAQLFDLVVEERGLIGAQRRLVRVQQVLQARASRKDVLVEANGAATKRNLFSLAHLGHHALRKLVGCRRQNGALCHRRAHDPSRMAGFEEQHVFADLMLSLISVRSQSRELSSST